MRIPRRGLQFAPMGQPPFLALHDEGAPARESTRRSAEGCPAREECHAAGMQVLAIERMFRYNGGTQCEKERHA